MEAPPENFAYTLLLSPDFSKPDALAVIDVKPGSPRERSDQASLSLEDSPSLLRGALVMQFLGHSSEAGD